MAAFKEETVQRGIDVGGSSSGAAVALDEIQIVRSDFRPENADYGFFTSHGGVSDGGALNVSIVVNDSKENVEENIRRAMVAIDHTPEDLCLLTSQYNNSVVTIDAPVGEPIKADGIVTKTPGLVLGNVSADAHSAVFIDDAAGVIGLAVGSWKGVAKGVIENVIEAMVELGASKEHIQVIVGPGLGKDSYEMGKPVRDYFVEGGVDARDDKPFLHNAGYDAFFPRNPLEPSKYMLDMPGLIAHKLDAIGVSQVSDVKRDTLIDNDFFGARRFTKTKVPQTPREGQSLEYHLEVGRNLNFVSLGKKKDISPDGIEAERESAAAKVSPGVG